MEKQKLHVLSNRALPITMIMKVNFKVLKCFLALFIVSILFKIVKNFSISAFVSKRYMRKEGLFFIYWKLVYFYFLMHPIIFQY